MEACGIKNPPNFSEKLECVVCCKFPTQSRIRPFLDCPENPECAASHGSPIMLFGKAGHEYPESHDIRRKRESPEPRAQEPTSPGAQEPSEGFSRPSALAKLRDPWDLRGSVEELTLPPVNQKPILSMSEFVVKKTRPNTPTQPKKPLFWFQNSM